MANIVIDTNGNALSVDMGNGNIYSGSQIPRPNALSNASAIKAESGLTATNGTGNVALNWTDNNSSLGNSDTIVVVGSSTSAGQGASTIANSYVGRLTTWLQANYKNQSLTNLAVVGYDSYKLMPTGYTPPTGRPTPDTTKNITAALALMPKILIINLPTNDVANLYTDEEYISNVSAMVKLAKDAGVYVLLTTTQPRNLGTAGQNQLSGQRNIINGMFSEIRVDFWSPVAASDGSIIPALGAGDGIHLNDSGHALIAANIIPKVQAIIESLIVVTYKAVERYDFTTQGWTTIASNLDRFATSYTDSTVASNKLYAYRIKTYSPTTSVYSSQVSTVYVSTGIVGRVLFDFGAADNQTTSPDSNGKYWNNVNVNAPSAYPATLISNPVNESNQVVTGMSVAINLASGAPNTSGTTGNANAGGPNVAVGIYPATAMIDNMFFDPTAGIKELTIVIPVGRTASSVRMLGSRAAAAPRILQVRKKGDTTWTEFDAAAASGTGGNLDYNQAAIFAGITGTQVFEIQVKQFSAFGYISVMEIMLT